MSPEGEIVPTSSHSRILDFGGPATYRIVVQGALSQTCRRRFAGMTIDSGQGDSDRPHTTLVGHLQDQAELRGVLDALYGLHLPVIAVERCAGSSPPASTTRIGGMKRKRRKE
jgi:hypothetical protein